MSSDPLSELTASRICHDLISPIGALSNGLELARDAGGLGGEEMALIEECAEAASATLRFFRFAFGAASGGDAISAAEAEAIVAPFMKLKQIALQWPEEPQTMRRADVKLRLLLILCLIDALPRGGAIRKASGGFGWVAEGPKLLAQRLSDRLEAAATGQNATPGDVHVALMLRATAERGLAHHLSQNGEGEIALTLR